MNQEDVSMIEGEQPV
jgi:serine/threonine protein kinase